MMNKKLYQNIYNEIDQIIPYRWDRLIIYLEYGEASYSFSFYIKSGKKYVKCFDIHDIGDEKIYSAFRNIDNIVGPEREKLTEKWTNATMVVSADGKLNVDLDYTDLSQGSYAYKKNWKKKYLA